MQKKEHLDEELPRIAHFPQIHLIYYADSAHAIHLLFAAHRVLQHQLRVLLPVPGAGRRPVPVHLPELRVEDSLAETDCGHLLPHPNARGRLRPVAAGCCPL